MLAYEEWRARLRASCLHYYDKPHSDCQTAGQFELGQVQGLDMASIRCSIDRIERTGNGIRRDDAEHFLLLYQIGGETGICHCDQDTTMEPGDFLLLDSTREAKLVFDGKTSEFYSVQLPRSLFLTDRRHPPVTGQKVTMRHPLHANLHNLIADTEEDLDLDSFWSEHFFDFVAMVFGPDPKSTSIGQFRRPSSQLRYVSQVIDQHLRQHDFSVDQLATEVGRFKRQLQRDLAQAGTSFTKLLQNRRLKHFVSAGKRYGRSGPRNNIAELAQLSGFFDQSHFDRLFRAQHSSTPNEVLKSARQ